MIVLSPDAVTDVERMRLFLYVKNPVAAQKALDRIWSALEQLQHFPNSGFATSDRLIRQIAVRFGASGYIVRYAVMPVKGDILVTRIWHTREHRV